MAEPTNPGQNTGDEEEQERLFDGNDPDEVKETVAAGLTAEEVGINALSSEELIDPTRAENHAGGEKSAQDVTNELDETAQGYASGHDSGVSQKEQYDVALSGAAEGRHEGTYFDQVQQQKELREREERRNIAVRAVTTYAQLLNFAYDLGEDFKEMAEDVAETASRVAETERIMNEQIQMYDDAIEEQQRIVDELAAREESLDVDEIAELAAARTQVDNLQMVRDALANERDQLVNDQRASEEALAAAQADYNQKRAAVENGADLSQSEREQLEADLRESEAALRAVEASNARVNQRVDFALDGAEQYQKLRMALTSPELNAHPASAQAVSAFAAEFINARADGEISQDDMNKIRARLEDENMPPQAREQIAGILQESISGSGVGVRNAAGELVYGDDAVDALLSGLRNQVEAADTNYATISAEALQAVEQIDSQLETLREELRVHQEELEAINDGSSPLLLGAGGLGGFGEGFAQNQDTPEEMQAAQRALKLAEIENTESRISLLESTAGHTRRQIEDTRDSYLDAHRELRSLEAQKSIGAGGDDIDDKIAAAEATIARYEGQIQALGDRSELAQAISELATRIQGKSTSCGANAAVEYAKADVIEARTAVTMFIRHAAADGELSQDDMDRIHTLFNTAQISDASRDAFVRAYSAGGGKVENASGDYVGGSEATDILASQLAEVREQQAQTREQIADTSEERAEIQQQIAALQEQRQGQQQALDSAQAALDRESAETAEIIADAQGAQAGMMAYDSVFDYMSNNYSHMLMGSGDESVSEVAAQADRMLTDNSGNLVYINPDTQEMYTLQKNNDGSVARDSSGAQIKVAVSAEDTADLYRKMFDNKLLPRNFVPDGDGILGMGKTEVAFAEHSDHDSFSESIGKSLLPGFMTKGQFSQVIDNSVAAQRAQEEAARLAQADAQADVDEARTVLEQASRNLSATDAELRALQQRLASLDAQEESLTEQGAGEWSGTDGMALETTQEMQAALVDVYRKVEGSAITKADLDQALGNDVSPEFRQQIEAALERDGIDIHEPDNELASDLDNTDNDIQMASSAQVTAFFPFLGIGPFQVSQIPTPTSSLDPNGIYPGMQYESVVDSPEFTSTNPTSGPEPTYLDPINNGTKDTPSAGNTFALALTNTGASSGAAVTGTSIQPPQLSAEEAIRLQREEELRMAENQAGLGSSTSMV